MVSPKRDKRKESPPKVQFIKPKDNSIQSDTLIEESKQKDQIEDNIEKPYANAIPPELIFDESLELERIEKEKAKGKNELVGNIFLNEACSIIGACQD